MYFLNWLKSNPFWFHWLKGLLIGLIILLILFIANFLFIWISSGAPIALKEMQQDYKDSLFCNECYKKGNSLFECAIAVCNMRSNSNCKEYFEKNLNNITEVNGIIDNDEIKKIEQELKNDFVPRQCGYLYQYENPKSINQARFINEPSFLDALFSSRAVDSTGATFSEDLLQLLPLIIIYLLITVKISHTYSKNKTQNK